MPAFWLGIILILIFSVHLQLFPVNGYGNTFVQHLDHLFLPAVTIALGFSTIVIRTLRSSTLAVLSSDYVDTARIKGISRFAVLRRHVLRNAIISVVVVFGINLAFLISGTVIIENVFGIPGVGRLLVDSVSTRDYPVVQGVTLIFAFLVVAVNLVTDVVHASLDPRVVLE
jgi:peptide/nickel transport system permease protein